MLRAASQPGTQACCRAVAKSATVDSTHTAVLLSEGLQWACGLLCQESSGDLSARVRLSLHSPLSGFSLSRPPSLFPLTSATAPPFSTGNRQQPRYIPPRHSIANARSLVGLRHPAGALLDPRSAHRVSGECPPSTRNPRGHPRPCGSPRKARRARRARRGRRSRHPQPPLRTGRP